LRVDIDLLGLTLKSGDMLTRPDIERYAREIWEEAFAADEWRVLEVTKTLLGSEVFVWSVLTVRQLRTLTRALLPTALESRG
jgi:hypothetical protein